MDIMRYEWNPEKNKKLKEERNISFEEVIFHLTNGNLWKISDHPNKVKYPNQKIFYIIIENYIFLVPFIKENDFIFLKTIIPSRKLTKEYHIEKGELR